MRDTQRCAPRAAHLRPCAITKLITAPRKANKEEEEDDDDDIEDEEDRMGRVKREQSSHDGKSCGASSDYH